MQAEVAEAQASEAQVSEAQVSEAQAAEPSAANTSAVKAAPALPVRTTLWDFIKVLPILLYTPETSLGFGAGLLMQFDMPGSQHARRPSSVAMGGIYTLENQVSGQLSPDFRFFGDRFVLKSDFVGARYPSRFHGIGNKTSENIFDTFTDCYFRAEIDARFRPFAEGHKLHSLFVGANHTAWWSHMRRPKVGDSENDSTFASIDDPGEDAVVAIGLGPSIAWDSRDSLSWPQKGTFADLKFTLYDPIVGSDVRYQRLALDVRHFQKLWFSHILALRFVSQSVWGDVPFQRLPQLGGASLFRGWYGGQLRERMMVALEAEYRVPLSPRWAVVAFGSVGRVANSVKHFDVRELRGAGGGGLRFSVDKRDRVNVRLDLAYGDSFSPYIQFREAF